MLGEAVELRSRVDDELWAADIGHTLPMIDGHRGRQARAEQRLSRSLQPHERQGERVGAAEALVGLG